QIPQPMQSSSEIHAVFEFGATSMQSLPADYPSTLICSPIFTTGQLFLHSCLHFFGLHL
ncbi:hypothetical protein COCSUDRAFT_10993, partial [Coccomyxa subellipsoidea C-169]